ncbi:MAG TPA: nucleotidyltransferase family protein [Abditibacteriaceae bacterium]
MNDNQQDKVAAIVLAAGMSQRMGRLKPLLPFGDKPMIARVIETLQQGGTIHPIIVVTGHAAPEIEDALREYSVQFAHNENFAAGGMLSSVQTGVRALPNDVEAFFLVLGDQPAVNASTPDALRQAWQQARAPVILPLDAGRRGHPVLFDRMCITEILALPEDATLKTVVQAHSAQTVEVAVADEGVLHDVDTPSDYQRALQAWRQRLAE